MTSLSRAYIDPTVTPHHTSRVRERLEKLITDYGGIALAIYLVIFGGTLVSFWLAINAGFEVDGAAAQGGTWLAAWAATKLTQPFRIGATLLLTPVVGAVVGRKGALDDPGAALSEGELARTATDD